MPEVHAVSAVRGAESADRLSPTFHLSYPLVGLTFDSVASQAVPRPLEPPDVLSSAQRAKSTHSPSRLRPRGRRS